MLKLHLGQVTALKAAIAELEDGLGERLEPFREDVRLLMTMPGISETAAHVIASEMGVDMRACARSQPGSPGSSARCPGSSSHVMDGIACEA